MCRCSHQYSVSMAVHTRNPLKLVLRKEMKSILATLGANSKSDQSTIVTQQVIYINTIVLKYPADFPIYVYIIKYISLFLNLI